MSDLFDNLVTKRWAYRTLFSAKDDELSRAARVVLKDLESICHVNEQIHTPSGNETHVRLGHFEIWQHIQNRMNLTNAQLRAIAQDEQTTIPENEDDGW